MTDEIRAGANVEVTPARRLLPMRVGGATVYVEVFGEPAVIEDDTIHPVAPPSPQEAFENAGEILRECVRVIGERIEGLTAKARPSEITVEFSLNFEVKGKASLIPVFITGETGAKTGLKLTALWKHEEDTGK
jgi:hypothetical protein